MVIKGKKLKNNLLFICFILCFQALAQSSQFNNPAVKIINSTIANRANNRISTGLDSYQYRSYNKLIVSANPDSISNKIDSIFVKKNGKKVFRRLDSTNYELKKYLENHHLYITEKVSENLFTKGKNNKEIILGSKMAGFKNPLYEYLALDIERFSFYDNVYTLLGEQYISPLTKNGLNKYIFKIMDTVFNNGSNAYKIYFKPEREKKKVGLEGYLYIDTISHSVQKGEATLKGTINVKIEQGFKYMAQNDIWFPDQTTITIRKGKSGADIAILGGLINLSNETDSNDKENSAVQAVVDNIANFTYIRSRTKNFDIAINKPVVITRAAATIEVSDGAAHKNERFWNTYRTDTLSNRALSTYTFIDSVSQAEDAERKFNIARKVVKGYYPAKYFDFDLSQLINFNNYEGIRLGLGLVTNHHFSNMFRLQGYAGYGLKDTKFKYHLAGSFRLNKYANTWVGVGYTNDNNEAGKMEFLFDDTSFTLINPRNINISQFYNYQVYDFHASADILPNVEAKLELGNGTYTPLFDYQFFRDDVVYNTYNLSLSNIAIKWTPYSEYMTTPEGKYYVRKEFPKIIGQYRQSYHDFLNGDFSFGQFSLKVAQQFKFVNKSSLEFLTEGGFTLGSAPLSHLYNARPNYSYRNPWRKRLNFSGNNAFETMAFNEFISDRFFSLQGRYNLKPIEISQKFKPKISIITRYALGTIDKPQHHIGLSFKKMNHGYFESGVVLNQLFKGFGLASFYRYGAYHNDKFSDNLAVKLTFVLDLGF